MQSSNRYTKTAIVLHWLIAIAIVGMFALGWYMTDIPKDAPKQMAFDVFDWGIYTWQLSEEASPRTFYFNFHKSLGMTIFALIVFRIFWRLTHKPPAMLSSYKAYERKLATGAHHLLYLLMIAVPLTGVLMSLYSKFALIWFGLHVVDGLDNTALRESFAQAHEIIGVVLLLVVIIHVSGAIKHQYIDKDDTMKRMSLK